MGEVRGAGREGTGLPWVHLLDPAANARALVEVQARGLEAAGELVERFIALVDDQRVRPAEGEAGPRSPSGDLGVLLEVWIDLVRRTAESFASLGGSSRPGAAGPGAVEVDVATGRGSATVSVVVNSMGTPVDGALPEVWLHNGTTGGVGPLSLVCTPPIAPDGTSLAGRIAFDPACVDELPARSSRGIVVTLCAAGPLAPGTYRSLVQATGAPEVWLPLEVVVREPDP